jgi:tetratricopeptide (TPR) repeat protein
MTSKIAAGVGRRLIAGLLVLSCLPVLAPGPALAAAPPSPGGREARELFQKAEMSFNLGRFSDALADYQAAYQAKPLPGFLFNIAQCYRNLQSYERARFFYRRYLALEPRSANRRLVEDLIAEMSRLVEKSEQAQAVANHATPPASPAPATPPALALAAVSRPPPAERDPALPAARIDVAAPAAAPARAAARPVYKRWWFWSALGAVAVGALVIGLEVTREDMPRGSLGTIGGGS